MFLWERATGGNLLASHVAGSAVTRSGFTISQSPRLTGDGSRVAFVSSASDLVEGQVDVNGPSDNRDDVFVFSRQAPVPGTTTTTTTTGTGTGGPILPSTGAGGVRWPAAAGVALLVAALAVRRASRAGRASAPLGRNAAGAPPPLTGPKDPNSATRLM